MTTHLSFLPANATNIEEAARWSDGEFLQRLCWNRHVPPALKQAARRGDVVRFTRLLSRRGGAVRRGSGRKKMQRLLAVRPALWSRSSLETSVRTGELMAVWESFGSHLQRPKGKRAVLAFRQWQQQQRESAGNPDGNGNPAGGNGSASPVPSPEKNVAAGKKVKTGRETNWFVSESRLATWLETIAPERPLRPCELLVLLELLAAVGSELSPPLLWSLWRTVLTAALRLPGLSEEPGSEGTTPEQRLILAGELPVAAGVFFGGIKGAGKLRRSGIRHLSQELLEATDTDGTPQAAVLERLGWWLPPFVRARQWAGAFRDSFWKKEAEERFRGLIRAVAPFCRTDGRLALSNGCSAGVLPVLTMAAATAGYRKKSRPVRLLCEIERRTAVAPTAKKGKKKKAWKRLTPPAKNGGAARRSVYGRPVTQSDWARVACLRSDWSTEADLLAVAHDGDLPRLDLSLGGVSLLQGPWDISLRLDDVPVQRVGEWECTCWFSDGDVDFLELRQKTDADLFIDRQILLSRTSRYACLADCLQGAEEGRLEYTARLPLVPEADTRAETETREIRLRTGGMVVRCYPLSLPCDRLDSAAGSLEAGPGMLQLQQTAAGGLVAPLFFDWSPRRRSQPAEWQRLTVGEEGRSLPAAAAGGYRLRVGSLHLVFYRSLRPVTTGRSLLGLHTRHETVVGNFTREGEIEPVLVVQ